MYFEDLTPFRPSRRRTYGWIDGPYPIGWLEVPCRFQQGDTTQEFRDRLRELCTHPVNVMRGMHHCQWCEQDGAQDVPGGNGEICVKGPTGRWYCAPTLVSHYVSSHGYRPPDEFMEAVLAPVAVMIPSCTVWSRPRQGDSHVVSKWLGRTIDQIVSVPVRREVGQPVVIENPPLQVRNAEPAPFPTLYWLVDPALTVAISEIERRGGVRVVEQRLASDSALMKMHIDDNKRYAGERWARLTAAEVRVARERGFFDVLKSSGIGGIADHTCVKCLHAQLAYHLVRLDAGGTAVGRMIEEQFGLVFRACASKRLTPQAPGR
ncbi:DUF501 domain-containing protein [Phycisphaeraceae bacterium D3-23]